MVMLYSTLCIISFLFSLYLFFVATIVCCTDTVTMTTVVVAAFQSHEQPHRQHYPYHTRNSVLQEQQAPNDEVEGAMELKKENKRNRRSFVLNSFAMLPFAAVVTSRVRIESAHASGGATAGGMYLSSAKKRYYERLENV